MLRTKMAAVLLIGAMLGACEAPPDSALQKSEALSVKSAAPVAAGSVAMPGAASQHLRVGAGAFYPPMPLPPSAGDRFREFEANKWQAVDEKAISTFSIDVDTASYAYMRRNLREGRLPPKDSIRIEELINYFPYTYPAPKDKSQPFKATATILPSPWLKGAKLLHIGIKGYDIERSARPRANLTFLIDVSGSMSPPDRLPLVQASLRQLVEGLGKEDRVAIVTYVGETSVALEPTKCAEQAKILAAIDGLRASGSTAGGAGITRAYAMAESVYDEKAVNRIILATDGDFNVGVTSPRQLEEMVAEKRKKGIYLTILGVGTGNLNDALMQRLAQTGNGQAAYIDSLLEARKVWIEELASTMFPIADDVKIQVEFNPAKVSQYRLIGYETRLLARSDFKNDKVDAGEIGSGHSVTAIYEFVPLGGKVGNIDSPRYERNNKAKAEAASQHADEYAFLRLRYKPPGQKESVEMAEAITEANLSPNFEAAPRDIRFAVAVAGFAQLLRNDAEVGELTYKEVAATAEAARGDDPHGWRAEFVQLVRLAESVKR
jgi:Ca-activated chloride channel family protein